MICYSATHSGSGKQYIGICDRDLSIRRAEHESHSASGTFNCAFHNALRKYGKDNFTWKKIAEGDEEVIRILERTLIGGWRTLVPRGFNSMNEASESELISASEDQLRFNQEMDTLIAETDLVRELKDVLRRATNDQWVTEETKDLMKPLISHLEDADIYK